MIITIEGSITSCVDIGHSDMEEITNCISLMLQMQGWDKDTVSTYIGQDLECVSKEDYDSLKVLYDKSVAELFEIRNTLTNIHTKNE